MHQLAKILTSASLVVLSVYSKGQSSVKLYEADDRNFQYTGRIDFTKPNRPRFWAAGVYIQARFKGSSCEIVINDEELWGKSHNYIEIAIDDQPPYRIQTTGKENIIPVQGKLSKGAHTITICKNTESGIGYLEFVGLRCKALLPPPPKPERKIECIGNSITCGTGTDQSVVLCDKGEWYDQHNAYYSYGARTARALKAQYHLTSVSGIGLMHSCCDMTITMPQVFDKINQRDDVIPWNVIRYQPDVVTICLGQNDGAQDSTQFSNNYISFLQQLRKAYPGANFVLITSPMADEHLRRVLKNYISGVVDYSVKRGDQKVSKFFFSKSWNSGCGGHPDLNEHAFIAAELTSYLKELMHW